MLCCLSLFFVTLSEYFFPFAKLLREKGIISSMSCDQGHLHSCVSEELQTYSVGYYHKSQLFSHHPLVNLSRYHTRYVIIFVCYTSSTTAIIYSVDIYTDLSRYIAIYLYMFACSQDNSGIN